VGESSTAAMTAEGSSSLDPDSSSGSTPSTSGDTTSGDTTSGDTTSGDTTSGDTTSSEATSTGDASTGDGSSSSSTDSTTSSGTGSSEGGTTGDPSECGNGAVEPGETCDDGNAGDGDGCDADCTDSVVTAVAVGGQHSCVLLDTGRVRCWGLGSSGQLGQGTTASIEASLFPWNRTWSWKNFVADELARLLSGGEFSRTHLVRSLARYPERVPPRFRRSARALSASQSSIDPP
jgi:cysteine-rich repeat protein